MDDNRNNSKPNLRAIQGGKPPGGDSGAPGKSGAAPEQAPVRQPGWAKDLRKLYDSVVEEPLPDSFADLLKKLDEKPDE